MRRNIEKTAKNQLIPDNIREFFDDNGLNVDMIFPESPEENLDESNAYSDARKIVNLVRSIDNSGSVQKALFMSFIIQLRNEIKKTQSQIADLSKNVDKIEKIVKDISGQIDDLKVKKKKD